MGGIKEKILAVHRAGITKFILPKEDALDLDEIPEDIKKELTFVLVDTIEEGLQEALALDFPCPVLQSMGNQRIPAPSF